MLHTGPLSAVPEETTPMSSWAGPMARMESLRSLEGGAGASPFFSLPVSDGGVVAVARSGLLGVGGEAP